MYHILFLDFQQYSFAKSIGSLDDAKDGLCQLCPHSAWMICTLTCTARNMFIYHNLKYAKWRVSRLAMNQSILNIQNYHLLCFVTPVDICLKQNIFKVRFMFGLAQAKANLPPPHINSFPVYMEMYFRYAILQFLLNQNKYEDKRVTLYKYIFFNVQA